MTNPNDAIDRALERLHECGLIAHDIPQDTDDGDIAAILTDLAAELKREFCREIYNDAADLQERCDKAQARLAAVDRKLDELRDRGAFKQASDLVELRALARGEGGGSGRASSTSVSRPAEQSASDARVPNPAAAPDAALDESADKACVEVVELRARLAAVVERIHEVLGIAQSGVVTANPSRAERMLIAVGNEGLDIARGEGGGQAGEAGELVSPAPSVPTADEPATPDAIDRALERLEGDFMANCCDGSFGGHQMINVEAVREWIKEQPVLTDLAAEIRAEEREKAKATINKIADQRTEIEDSLYLAEARLAAVVDLQRQWSQTAGYNYYARVLGDALTRGEGGEQVSSLSETASKTSEPATPDAAQITMHALDLDHLRGECRECGREPEHPCHGETGHQQSPASDGGLDEIVLQLRVAIMQEYGVDGSSMDALIRAACICARETDPLSQARLEALSDACTKLAAVRAWRDKWREDFDVLVGKIVVRELDAILDGKED